SQLGYLWWDAYPRLAEAILEAGDVPLIDLLAGCFLFRTRHGFFRKLPPLIDRLADHYESLLREDPAEFAWRAVGVLSAVPAYSAGNYAALVRSNRLARVLYERSATAHLHHPGLVRDLLEAPEIHVQALALRVLGQDDDRARALAADNLDLLLATPLRPLHRG